MKSHFQFFFLHFAGGNCYSFDFLIKEFHSSTDKFDFFPLELPGRGNRFDEPLLEDKGEAIDDYLNQIKSKRNGQPYIIYGHSMGATLGLSLVKKMEEIKDAPILFVATGNPGPGVKSNKALEGHKRKRHLLNDEEFKEELRTLGGVPEVILTNNETFSFFSKILRSDFKLLEEEEDYQNDVVINTPIIALMGDEENASDQITNWRKFTTSHAKYQVLRGNHFFIYTNARLIVSMIFKKISILDI